jgi:hypothetical protein
MKQIISLDNTKIQVTALDLDRDGVVVGVEIITPKDNFVQDIIQPSEIPETIRELNRSEIDALTKKSSMDMRGRFMNFLVMGNIVALDTIVAMGVCPESCLALSESYKRDSVSIQGEGRKEIVNLAIGKQEQDARKLGFVDTIKTAFGKKPEGTQ